MAFTIRSKKDKCGRSIAVENCKKLPPDTTKMMEAANDFFTKMSPPTIQELYMHFGGDKSVLVEELLGDDADDEKAVKRMRNNVNRWLSSNRKPSKKNRIVMKELYTPVHSSLKIRITGCVNVSQEWTYRQTYPVEVPIEDVNDFLQEAMEDNEIGLQRFNAYYLDSSGYDDTFTWLSNIKVDMWF